MITQDSPLLRALYCFEQWIRTLGSDANFRVWLQAAVRGMSPSRPVYPGQQTFEQDSPFSHRLRLLHPQMRTSPAMHPFVWCRPRLCENKFPEPETK